MPSLYDLVFTQSQPEDEIPSRDDGCHDDNALDTLEDDVDVFRKEAREALMRRRQEAEKMVDFGNMLGGKKKKQRIHARPTMYRTEEEKMTLREAHQRSANLATLAVRNKWNYLLESTNDADAGDVIFQTLAAEEQHSGNLSSSDTEEEHETTLPKSTGKKARNFERKVHPRRVFGPGKNIYQWYTPTDKTVPPTLRSLPTKFWPLALDAPKCTRQNPIDRHLNQLSFVAARLLLNACGSTHSPLRPTDACRNNHPTVLTLDAIEHLYHAPRDPNTHSYGVALRFALAIIQSSSTNTDEVRTDEAGYLSKTLHQDYQHSWHDLIQKRINEALSLWRDFHSHSISRRKQEYLRKQKKYHAKEQCQANNLKRRSRKDLLLYDGLNDKIFIDIDHLTPCSNFLHIFEMTSSLFLCILGDILLSEQDDNWEKNRQRYQDEDEDDDGIYNIASLYQEEEEGIDDKYSQSSLVMEYEMAFKNFCFDFRKYAKEKFLSDCALNLMSFPLFMAVQRVQSFLCNSGIRRGGIDEVAEELVKIGNDVLDEPQLRKYFGDVHVTTGIARIVSSFSSLNSPSSSSAAAIVSSACNSRSNLAYRTPFDIMRLAFHKLSPGDDFSDSLEGAANDMYRASHVFESCWLNDPNNSNAHMWHLASLLGSLILSSGKLRLFYDASPCHNLNEYAWAGQGQLMNKKFHIFESIRKEASTAFIQLQRKINLPLIYDTLVKE